MVVISQVRITWVRLVSGISAATESNIFAVRGAEGFSKAYSAFVPAKRTSMGVIGVSWITTEATSYMTMLTVLESDLMGAKLVPVAYTVISCA